MADDPDLSTLTPTFIVYINGSRLAVDQEAAVKHLVVQDRLDAPSSLSLCLSDPKRQWTDSEDFAEGNAIKVELGYKDDVAEVFQGEVTGMAAEFRRGSDGIVTVRAHSVLHRLCAAKKTLTYSHKNDTDILKEILSSAGLTMKGDDVGVDHETLTRSNQSDYEYLMHVARRYGCRVWAEEKEVHIEPAPDRGGDTPIVEWGKTLLEFHGDSDTRSLVTGVEIKGWNRGKLLPINGKAKAADVTAKVGGDKLGAQVVSDNFGEAVMVFVDREITDKNTADTLALEILTKNSFTFMTGHGRAEGNPKIVAGGTVTVKEAGDRFSGDYQVDSVKHVFDTTVGYSTAFSVSRNAV